MQCWLVYIGWLKKKVGGATAFELGPRPRLDVQFSAGFETSLHLFGRKQPTVQIGCFRCSTHHKSTFIFLNMEEKQN